MICEFADERMRQKTAVLSSFFATKLRASTHKTIETANGSHVKVVRTDRFVKSPSYNCIHASKGSCLSAEVKTQSTQFHLCFVLYKYCTTNI